MKKSDIAMIVLIASISVLVSYFVTQSILGSPSNQTAEVETIKEINGWDHYGMQWDNLIKSINS